MTRVLAVAMACGLWAWPSQVYRSTAESVPVFVTVLDKSGHLVGGLTRDDFQILDNGKPQPLTSFDSTPQPVRLIVMTDISGSMTGNLLLLRGACDELIKHLGSDDLARLGTFGKEILLSPTFSRSAADLTAWLPTQIALNAPTPLWQSVDQAMGEFASAPAGRRVVLVLSDGKDTGPIKGEKRWLTQIEIGERAEREDVMIYGVGVYGSLNAAMRGGGSLGGMMASTLPDPGLGTVAQETGGGYVELRGRDDLSATFARIVDELHQQYLMSFTPPARDGKVHKLEVRMRTSGQKARARKTYQASK